MVWEKEFVLECWKTGIMCAIVFEKDGRLVCENYRYITLLSVTYKILSCVLNESLKEYVENIFGEYQCGFRPYRNKIDQILVIRQMSEKFYEHDIDIHMLFMSNKPLTALGESKCRK
jgi:hypothetical protein